MKKKLVRYIVLCSVLGIYSFLYLATSYNKYNCTYDDCQKFEMISDSLRSNPFVQYSTKCQTNQFCVYVKDSISRDWSGLSDTTCRLLQERSAPQFVVSIISTISRDTLLNRNCP